MNAGNLAYRLRALAGYHEARGTGLPPEEMRALADEIDPPQEHKARVTRWYDEPTPTNGIRGEWRCSCGSSGTSSDPQGAVDRHLADAKFGGVG